MCNTGKFIDRNPGIRAAGVSLVCGEKAEDSLKIYPTSELAEVWFKAKCPRKPVTDFFPTTSILPNDTLHDVLAPELLKSRFVKFKEQFFEDLYLRKPELGKARQVHSIPEGLTNENMLFGIETKGDESLYELILPRKTVAEVNREYIDWHDKYVLSHKHYLPGEQIKRKYNQKFNPKAAFGKSTNVDITGGQVRRCLTQKDKLYVVKDLQKYYLERNFGDVGKKISKFKDPHLEDPSRVFGHPPNPNKCTLRDVVHNIDPCEEGDNLQKAISYLIHERTLLQKDAQFDVFELEKKLEKQDKDKTGYIPLQTAFSEARSLYIHLNERRMRDALIFYKLVEDIGLPTERIKIEHFSKALQFRYLLPEIAMKRSIPAFKLDTTYRELCGDYIKPAPPIIPHLKKPEEDYEDCSSPEVFDRPREKTQLKRIFADIICFESFDQFWETIKQKLKPENDMLSINDIRKELKATREKQKESLKA